MSTVDRTMAREDAINCYMATLRTMLREGAQQADDPVALEAYEMMVSVMDIAKVMCLAEFSVGDIAKTLGVEFHGPSEEKGI